MSFGTLPVRELPIRCVSLSPRTGQKPASLDEAAAPKGRVRAQRTWTLESKPEQAGCRLKHLEGLIANRKTLDWREREHWNSCIKSPLQAESEAVTGSLSNGPRSKLLHEALHRHTGKAPQAIPSPRK